ncbi:glutathione S-transferase family protein [Bradyrhizobium icense]|uniref:Glutathione S-transferase n=1 Tax=Bradyrhizobium icense TaxID=1274631 RepID=A0A1B1URW3_9BRAD|nr:glutathione S-transferase family protein [Bradyrhizobium icense]ANW05388.1 glutathione S-transferase [Bradyrhizobium icense]
MKLFFALKTISLASQIALEEAGADYEVIPVDLQAGEQRSEKHLALNPLGRVPVLVVAGKSLTETPAILSYISRRFPESQLHPEAEMDIARMESFNSYLCSTVHIAHSHRMRGYRWADDVAAIESMRKKVPQTMSECFGLIERNLFSGPWVLGSRYSLSDPYLFTMASWLEGDGVDIRKFPLIQDHYQRMSERPAVKRAIAKADAALGAAARDAQL